MTEYKLAFVVTDSYYNDVDGKSYKTGSLTVDNEKTKPLMLFFWLDDYKRTWDDDSPVTYDSKNEATIESIDYTDGVLTIKKFDYNTLEDITEVYEVGKEVSIDGVVNESYHTLEYSFKPTKIVVGDDLEKDSSIFEVLTEDVWKGFYQKEKLPKAAENVKNAETFNAEIGGEVGLEELESPEVKSIMNHHGIKIVNREMIERVAWGRTNDDDIDYVTFSGSRKGLEQLADIIFEGDLKDTIRNAEYEKTDYEGVLGIENGNGKIVGTVSIEDVSDNKDKVFISIDGYNEEDHFSRHPMIWDGVIPESPFMAESFEAEGGGTIDYENTRMVSIEQVITVNYTWSSVPDDADVDDYTVNQEVEGQIEREMHQSDSGYGIQYVYDQTTGLDVQVEYNWDKTIEDGGEEMIKSWAETNETFGAEDDGWVKSTASERISGYSSFLRKKQFHFEKEFTMPPYPNTLKIDVDGYFTGISYEDEDESYFNTPEFIKERKEFVKTFTDSKLQEILEKYTMSKVKIYYEEIADDNYFGEREEEEEEDISDWGLTDEEIAEYKQEVAEEKAQNMADLEEEMNSHIEYCDDYFKEQMNDYMSDWSYSWMGEETNGQGHFMGHILPTFLPTHIKFVDETKGITIYEYNNQGGDILSYDAETFEANAKTGNKVYVITRRCEDYSEYRELDVAGFGSLTEARKKFNILFKEAKAWDYEDETIADAKEYMRWGDYWGIMSFNNGGMIYELREVIVGDKGDFDAETFESEEDYFDCIACEKELSESRFTKDEDGEMCDLCFKTNDVCSVCQNIELRTDLHYDSTGMMKLCERCEKYDERYAESFEANAKTFKKRKIDAETRKKVGKAVANELADGFPDIMGAGLENGHPMTEKGFVDNVRIGCDESWPLESDFREMRIVLESNGYYDGWDEYEDEEPYTDEYLLKNLWPECKRQIIAKAKQEAPKIVTQAKEEYGDKYDK